MIDPRLVKWVGGGVIALVVVGFVLFQANSLMKKGVALGKAEAIIEKNEARIAELETALEGERAECRGHVTSLNAIIENCGADLAERTRLGELYRAELESVTPVAPPEPVVIEIESTTLTEAILEGHLKAIQMMEVFQ